MSMYYSDFPSGNEIYHFGIKGQKWGVRRYQNSDGTLTAEGKVRYNDDGTKATEEQRKKRISSMSDKGLQDASRSLDKKAHRLWQVRRYSDKLSSAAFGAGTIASAVALGLGANKRALLLGGTSASIVACSAIAKRTASLLNDRNNKIHRDIVFQQDDRWAKAHPDFYSSSTKKGN